MPRFRLTLAYDGRPFAGWQSQPSGQTIQDTLERAILKILPDHPVRVMSSGRTDAGVHALGQVVHFDTPPEKALPPEAWQRALNVHLPPSIRVMDSRAVPDAFHARFDATGKTYRYRIWTGAVLPPLEAGLAFHHPRPLDPDLLRAACAMLEGTHDFTNFAAFRGNEDGTEDNTRTIRSVVTERQGDVLTITFHGSGFLYKMVRLLTGALLRVAVGREPLTWLADLLHRRVPGKCAHVAPADGLYLVKVDYPDNV
jgi:tRNA pseudouridine38-40 synthase